jgi:GDP-4-dehydro-6-deoxy-D-mannose reductase
MKKCLVTGCNGFIGSYLTQFLINRGFILFGTVHKNVERISNFKDKFSILECDITDKEKINYAVSVSEPDLVFHLAAKSRSNPSWLNPEETIKHNVIGTLYLLDALRRIKTDPTVVVVCSAAEYGCRQENDPPIDEQSEFRPSDPYAVSKVAQDLLSALYWENYGLKVIRVRPFNITGAGIRGDACSDFAKGIVEIENGRQKSLNVGNLSSIRDLTDVRDAITALSVIARKGKPGDVYNVCSGVGYRIGDVLDKLIHISGFPIDVFQKENGMTDVTNNTQIGNNMKLSKLGWKPIVPLEQTLLDLLNYQKTIGNC